MKEQGNKQPDNISTDKRDSQRLEHAINQLTPYFLAQHILVETMINSDLQVPKIIMWSKDTKLGQTNIYPEGQGNPPIPRYFKSEQELLIGFYQLEGSYRSFNLETDSKDYGVDPKEYSTLMISPKYKVAVGCKQTESGDFAVHVITSRRYELEILETFLENQEEDIRTLKRKKNKLRERVLKLRAETT